MHFADTRRRRRDRLLKTPAWVARPIEALNRALTLPLPPWQRRVAAAVLLPLAAGGLHHLVLGSSGRSPDPIVYVVPIVLASAYGGLGPGLLASALSGALFVVGSAAPADTPSAEGTWIDLGLLLFVGAGVTGLVAVIRELRQRATLDRRVLDAVVSNATDTISLRDLDGRYLFANEAFAATLNLRPEQVIGRTMEELFPTVSVEDASRADARVIATGGPIAYEQRHLGVDGQERVYSISKGPVRDATGKVVAIQVIGRDITARVNAEAEARFFTDVVKQMPVPVLIGDMERRITFINPAFTRLFGFEAHELVGRLAAEAIPQSDATRALEPEVRKAIAATGEWTGEVERSTRDGTWFPVITALFAVKDADGKPVGLATSFVDLRPQREREALRKRMEDAERATAASELARAHAEAELRLLSAQRELKRQISERSARLAALHRLLDEVLETLPFGVVVYDEALRLVLRNQRFGTLLHYPPELLAGASVHIADLIRVSVERGDHPGRTVDEVLDDIARARDKRAPVVVERRLFDGVQLEVASFPLAAGWTLVTYSDITETKRIQAGLEAARREAEAATLAKSEFLANMSHEIRTPMKGVLGLAYLLEREDLPDSALDLLRRIRQAGRSLQSVINDVLDFSKIEAGYLEIEQADFVLDTVLDHLSTLMAMAAADRLIELAIVPPLPPAPRLVGDPLRLGQVLVNLTSNAIKFTERGYVVVSIEVVEAGTHEVQLRFTVQDTGIGIAAGQQEEIFHPFAQADQSTTRRFGGTGLGLSISRRLVELMGGHLEVRSAVGEGSVFSFTLRFPIAGQAPLSEPALRSLEVLVVDDHPIALDAIEQTIACLGWVPHKADSAETALVLLRELWGAGKKIDLLVVDWKLPGMDGLELARQIRREVPAGHRQPVVVLATAGSRAEAVAEDPDHVVDAVLSKPLTPSTLLDTVIAAPRRRALRRDARESRYRRLEGLRLLVVDDSELNRDVARRIFVGEGAHVQVAHTGRQALDLLQASPHDIDIVLMDVQMPEMDGLEATRLIRATPSLRHLRVVALTAGAFASQQKAAQAAGMDDYIAKPFDVEATVSLIRRVAGLSDLTAPPAPAPTVEDDLPGLAVGRALSLWKDATVYRTYLARFIDAHRADVEGVLGLDREAGGALAHKLRGPAASSGSPRSPTRRASWRRRSEPARTAPPRGSGCRLRSRSRRPRSPSTSGPRLRLRAPP